MVEQNDYFGVYKAAYKVKALSHLVEHQDIENSTDEQREVRLGISFLFDDLSSELSKIGQVLEQKQDLKNNETTTDL